MNTLHHRVIDALLIVIALHICAIAFYAIYKKQALTPPMVHGKKLNDKPGIPSSRLILAFIIAIIVAVGLYYAISVLPPEPVDQGFYY